MYVDMDDIYDPKMLIWKETLFNCDEELLIKMVDEIYEHDIGSKKREEITIIKYINGRIYLDKEN